jgi:Domain of unknown function
MEIKIKSYIKDTGPYFTRDWFDDIMQQYQNKWERVQVIGLGSVLITTITFAAAFTIPGGYNQEDGTPILGRKYIFKAFVLANAQSFIQAFTSLFILISSVLVDPNVVDLQYATYTFIAAAGCMVMAFGLGSYVLLVPVSKPIAIIVLVYSLQLGSPFMYPALEFSKYWFGKILNIYHLQKLLVQHMPEEAAKDIAKFIENFVAGVGLSKLLVFELMTVSYLAIFILALV